MFFKRKRQKVDKKFVIFLSTVAIIALLSVFVYFTKGFLNNSRVVVTTDRRNYKEGGAVSISIVNKRKTPIYFIQRNGAVNRVWDIQIMESGEWVESKEPIFGDAGRYLLENKNTDSAGKCSVSSGRVFKQQVGDKKDKLLPGESRDFIWDQQGCLISFRDDDTYIKLAARGMYRVYFEYSYDRVGEDGSIITDKEAVYSRPFYLK